MTTLTVYPAKPGDGPVHVGDGRPLCHPDTRDVTDSPLIRALIASGRLRQTKAIERDADQDKTTRNGPARRRRQETT